MSQGVCLPKQIPIFVKLMHILLHMGKLWTSLYMKGHIKKAQAMDIDNAWNKNLGEIQKTYCLTNVFQIALL